MRFYESESPPGYSRDPWNRIAEEYHDRDENGRWIDKDQISSEGSEDSYQQSLSYHDIVNRKYILPPQEIWYGDPDSSPVEREATERRLIEGEFDTILRIVERLVLNDALEYYRGVAKNTISSLKNSYVSDTGEGINWIEDSDVEDVYVADVEQFSVRDRNIGYLKSRIDTLKDMGYDVDIDDIFYNVEQSYYPATEFAFCTLLKSNGRLFKDVEGSYLVEIESELNMLFEAFPALTVFVSGLNVFELTKSVWMRGRSGEYDPNTMDIRIAYSNINFPYGTPPENIEDPLKTGNGVYSISGGSQYLSTFRHEIGHHVYFNFPAVKDQWLTVIPSKQTNGEDYIRAAAAVSRYSLTNESEFFAEAFAVYTSPYYRSGFLSADIHGFFLDLLGPNPLIDSDLEEGYWG